MRCNFSDSCSPECKKYPMCAYMSVQSQLSDIQNSINIAFKSILDINKKVDACISDIILLENRGILTDDTAEVNDENKESNL